MNLNKKIEKLKGDGIPRYNEKINDLIDAVNWLAGVRAINGKNVRESDQGPVFDLSQTNNTQAPGEPWKLDPNGNPAGWSKLLIIDPSYSTSGLGYLLWVWSGPYLLQNQLSWLTDPDGNPAQWVQHQVCEGTSVVNKWFWGTP
jgi:hypothetical protein